MSMQATAEEVLSEAKPLSLRERFTVDDIHPLRPGQDYVNGVLYYTFPLVQPVKKKIGKGKDAPVINTFEIVPVCIGSDRDFFIYEHDELTERSFMYSETFTKPDENRWTRDDIIAWTEGESPTINAAEVFASIQQAYRTHVQFEDDMHYTLVPLYVIGSYLFQLYWTIGYIHFNGTAASGKSQNLKIMKALGFNAVWSSNMSEASLFRTTAGVPGVLCIDEAEHFNTEKGQMIRQLLNTGYQAGQEVMRTEKEGDTFVQRKYPTYSPKIIASITPLEAVLSSRCLIINMQPATRLIPEFNEHDPKWQTIRSHLYYWSLQNATRVKSTIDAWNKVTRHELAPKLTNRTWQISQLYVTLADYILGRDAAIEIINYLTNYFNRAAATANESDRQRKLLRILPRVFALRQSPMPGALLLKHIVEILKDYSEEDEADYIKTQGVSRNLTALGFIERKPHKEGSCVVMTEDQVREQMRRRSVDPYEEDERWFRGESQYTASTLFDTPVPEPVEPDSYSWMDALTDSDD